MVNTRSRASKRRDKGKQRAVENPPGGSEASPLQTSGENSVGHPVVPQFVTVEQLGKAMKQVQDAMIKGICEQMKVANPSRVEEEGVGQGSRVRLSPQKTPIDIPPSRSVATPYASREHGEAWYMG